MMKTVVIVLAFLLAFSTTSLLAHQSSFGPSTCCFHFQEGPMKKANVLSYAYTSSLCSMEGVLLKMKNGAKVCVNPSMNWVKRIIDEKPMS